MSDRDVLEILRLYPRIYHACHVRHARARSTGFALSDRDSMLLGHLDGEVPRNPGDLAEHMGVAPSTMTETIDRLEGLGYVARSRNGRGTEIRLTPRGEEAMAATSILDAGRVGILLARLAPRERSRAIGGLALLASAADRMRRDPKP
ncbi:MAG: MarR family transcriptional regulator [Planctomycetes bacterium]|nr:MarR family transcriptional regulator [Planctomycetota bacterium]